MLNKKFRETFDNVKPSDYIKNKTLNEIFRRKKIRHNCLKVSFSLLIINTFFISVGVFALEKSDFFNTLHVWYKNNIDEKVDTYIESDAFVEINYKADIPDVDDDLFGRNTYEFKDLEKKLGIRFLKSEKFNDRSLKQGITKKNNGNIGYSQFFIEMVERENYMITRYNISLKTKYYLKSEMYEELPYSYNSEKYYIDSLNTTAIISNDDANSFRITFDYDNISYSFLLMFKNNVDSKNEVLYEINELLNSLKY